MAELADARGSKPREHLFVWVRLPPAAHLTPKLMEQAPSHEEKSHKLTEQELEELKEEFGVKEGDNTIYIEEETEDGTVRKHHFPKASKYRKKGGGFLDLRERIKKKKKEINP